MEILKGAMISILICTCKCGLHLRILDLIPIYLTVQTEKLETNQSSKTPRLMKLIIALVSDNNNGSNMDAMVMNNNKQNASAATL